MATSCEIAELLVIVIVTLPALASSVVLSYLSSLPGTDSVSCWPPPPLAAAPPLLVPVSEEVLSSSPPQPASASRAVTPKMLSRFMAGTLPLRRNQELQQRLLRVQPVLGLVPDRRAVPVEQL